MKNIEQKYNDLKIKYSRLLNLSDEYFKELDTELKAANDRVTSDVAFGAILSIIFIALNYPLVINAYLDLLNKWCPTIYDLFKKYSYLRWESPYQYIVGFLIFVIPLYTIIFPIALSGPGKNALRKFKSWSPHVVTGLLHQVEIYVRHFKILSHAVEIYVRHFKILSHAYEAKEPISFYILAITTNYLVLFIWFYLCAISGFISQDYLIQIIKIWALVPGLMIGFFPSLLFMILLVFLSSKVSKKSKIPFSICPEKIVPELIELLELLDSLNKTQMSANEKNLIVKKIEGISAMMLNIKLIYSGQHGSFSKEIDNAAFCFLTFKTYVLLASPESMGKLKRNVIRTLNIMITGNFGNLINTPALTQVKYVTKVEKTFGFMGLILYLSLPVLIWMFTVENLHFSIDEISKSLITVLYSVWAIMGIATFGDILAPEVKTLIFDLLKNRFSKEK